MKVLVAGATGVLGRATISLLLAQGHEVVALARSKEAAQALEAQGVQPIEGNLLDGASLVSAAQGAARGAQAVLHLATVIPADATLPGAWLPNDKVRIEGTRNLLEAARKAGATRYVQQSITRIYQDNGQDWIDETTPLASKQPAHLESTMTMESLVKAAKDLQTVILRGGQFYGAGTTTDRLLDSARAGTLRLDGNGEHYISLIQPEDMAQAVVLALSVAPDTGVLNVVDDEPLTQKDFYTTVRMLVNPECQITQGAGDSRVPSRRCSNAKIKALGFVPKYPSHKEGLKDACAKHA